MLLPVHVFPASFRSLRRVNSSVAVQTFLGWHSISPPSGFRIVAVATRIPERHSDVALFPQNSLVLVERPSAHAAFLHQFFVGSTWIVLDEFQNALLSSHLAFCIIVIHLFSPSTLIPATSLGVLPFSAMCGRT